jgi:hypothetical protein
MRDRDGYLIEVGQSTGLLEGRLAKKRPQDLPGLGDRTTGRAVEMAPIPFSSCAPSRVGMLADDLLGLNLAMDCDDADGRSAPGIRTSEAVDITLPARSSAPHGYLSAARAPLASESVAKIASRIAPSGNRSGARTGSAAEARACQTPQATATSSAAQI